MVSIAAGVALAVIASCCYNFGIALQALDAREVDAKHALRVSLLRILATRRNWLLGSLLTVVGWLFQVVALTFVALAVVQPALSVGLVPLLFVGARMLHEPVGRREVGAVAAVVGGVVLASATAPPRGTGEIAGHAVELAMALLGVAALLPYLLRRSGALGGFGRAAAIAAMAAAGLAFSWSSFATKLAADALSRNDLALAAVWSTATLAAAALAILAEMSALQELPATRVAPVVFSIDLFVPVVLAVTLSGERLASAPLGGAPFVLALLLVAAGAVSLSTSAKLTAASGIDEPG